MASDAPAGDALTAARNHFLNVQGRWFDPNQASQSQATWAEVETALDALIAAARAEGAAEERRLRRDLELAAIRLGILTARMRACHEETGQHELLDEADMFVEEAHKAARSPSSGTEGT